MKRGWDAISAYPCKAQREYTCEVCKGVILVGSKYWRHAGTRLAHPECIKKPIPADKEKAPIWLRHKPKLAPQDMRVKVHHVEPEPLRLHPPKEVMGDIRVDKMIECWEEELRVMRRRMERVEKELHLDWDGR